MAQELKNVLINLPEDSAPDTGEDFVMIYDTSSLSLRKVKLFRLVPDGMSATKIADGSITNIEFQALDNVTSNIQTQLNSKMPTATYDSNGDGVVDKSAQVVLVARNDDPSQLAVGTPVYVSGANNTTVLIKKAKADSASTSSAVIGLVAGNSVNAGTDGTVLFQGTLDGVNTQSFEVGDSLWVSATTAGSLTNVRPTAPSHAVFIGWVAVKSATVGKIVVQLQQGSDLAELHDVKLTSPDTNHFLIYDATAGKTRWENKSAGDARTALGLGSLATQNGTFSGTSSGTNTGDQNTFTTIAVAGQNNVVADQTSDTLTLTAGSGITLTTDANTDTITIASSTPLPLENIMVAVTDEVSPIYSGESIMKFRMPYAFNLTGIKGSLTTAQTSGNLLTVDVTESGGSILSTKMTFDNTESTTVTAATPAVLVDTYLADDAEIAIDVDQIGGSANATGLKVTFYGQRTTAADPDSGLLLLNRHYGSSAVAAYSVRKLNNTYTGAALRVKRSSDSAEQDIGFDASGNLDEASLITFCNNGSSYGAVITWYDQSGNGYHATGSALTNAPRIWASSGGIYKQNTRPSLYFLASSSFFLNLPSGLLSAVSGNDVPLSIFTVANFNSPSNGATLGPTFAGSTAYWYQDYQGGYYRALKRDSAGSSASLTNNTYMSPSDALRVFQSVSNTAGTQLTTAINRNSSNSSGFDVGSSTYTTGYIGRYSTTYSNIYHSEIIIYTTSREVARADIRNHMSTYYNIS